MLESLEKSNVSGLVRFATANPKLSILSDHPVDYKELPSEDVFEFQRQLGPVYDIIRSPNSRLPLAMAIFGAWGTGKTSAMRWLQGLLLTWNDHLKESEDKSYPLVETVWFEPWRYSSREEVWRGLIAEVILKCIYVKDADPKLVANALSRFGGYLGRTFVSALSSAKLKASLKSGAGSAVAGMPEGDAGVEISLAFIEKAVEDFKNTNHPEKAYLNEFEQTFKGWLSTALGGSKRLVVFIDDLDRCLPEVALEVLEALKLYLDSDRLVVVAGVDEAVVLQTIQKHYADLGVDTQKSKKYLAKIFQLEVRLNHPIGRINEFLEAQLANIALWEELNEDYKQIFMEVIQELCDRNPREVKRIINKALIYGYGYQQKVSGASGDEASLRLAQGMQAIFVYEIILRLDAEAERNLLGTGSDALFFKTWSDMSEDDREHDTNSILSLLRQKLKQDKMTRKATNAENELTAAEERLRNRPLWKASRGIGGIEFTVSVLSNKSLRRLMNVPFAVEAVKELESTVGAPNFSEDPILACLSRVLGRDLTGYEDIEESDYSSVSRLSLAYSHTLSNLSPLRSFLNLKSLDITSCESIRNIYPLAGLVKLERLDLSFCSSLCDISSLTSLIELQWLSLDYCRKIVDIRAIGDLRNLNTLSLSNCTGIESIEPVLKLSQLKWLDISECADQINVEKLSNSLPELEQLWMSGCKIENGLKGIERLKDLESLQIEKCDQLESIAPLIRCPSLSDLCLSCNSISDLMGVLPKLKKLSRLEVHGASRESLREIASIDFPGLSELSISFPLKDNDLRIIGNMSRLRELTLSGWHEIEDLDALSGLINLRVLNLQFCHRLEDVATLAKLSELSRLTFFDCENVKIPPSLFERSDLQIEIV